MRESRTVPLEATVACPLCAQQHVVRGEATLRRQQISFGGGERHDATTSAAWRATILCPRKQTTFDGGGFVPAAYDELVVGVTVHSVTDAADGGGPTPAPASAPVEDWADAELAELRKTTVATQRVFATTMLTASSGGVAVYFAVLKYLGWEQADLGDAFVVATVVPPVLLLLAAAAFALALRPSLSYVDRAEYADFRARRIGQIHRRIDAGTTLYVAALVLAILVFFVVLQATS